MEIKQLDPNDLINYEYNNKIHNQKQIDLLANSIKEYGMNSPIIIDSNNIIIAGHGRLEACQKLGLKEVPTIIKNDLTEKQIKKYRLLDNKIAELAEDNIENIKFELEDLQDLELNELYDLDLEIVEDKEEVEDDVPEIQDNIIVEKGDIFQLGNHRLMCGDSTNIDDVEKLMNGEKADMVFTDPPYGMDVETDFTKIADISKGTKHTRVIGDAYDFNNDFINNIFILFGYCKEIFLWGADYYAELLLDKNKGSWVVWDKTGGKDIGFSLSEFELCWSKQKHHRKILRDEWRGIIGLGKEDTKKRVHPTQKPVSIIETFIKEFGKNTKSIVDIFGGGGSTLIASEKTNRKCYMMELDEKYIQVIIKRFYDYTDGKKEIKCLNREIDLESILNPNLKDYG